MTPRSSPRDAPMIGRVAQKASPSQTPLPWLHSQIWPSGDSAYATRKPVSSIGYLISRHWLPPGGRRVNGRWGMDEVWQRLLWASEWGSVGTEPTASQIPVSL